MKRKTRKKENLTTVFLVILLTLSIGYAYVSTQMNIKTKIGLDGNKWDVHFENVVISEDSVEAETPPTSNNLTTTEIPYEVNLVKLGDFYEFDVDVVNSGSLDAMVDLATTKVYEINGNVETEVQLPKYLSSSITYKNGKKIDKKHLLASGERTTITIKVVFRDDIDPIYFPSDSDKKFKFKTSISYIQADEYAIEGYSNDVNCNNKITKILAAKDDYRNPDQSLTNLDIGLDDDCNVINLDWWVNPYTSVYYKKNEEEVALGKECTHTAATSAAQVVNGKVQTPIPAYILFDGDSEFLPVTEIGYVFGNLDEYDLVISKVPKLPHTVKILGDGFMARQPIEEVTIPNNIEIIKQQAFYRSTISKLKFEENSKLSKIYEYSFDSNYLSDALVLPQSVSFIDSSAFTNNNLTSVTFPSSAEYFSSSFDSGVTINHNY